MFKLKEAKTCAMLSQLAYKTHGQISKKLSSDFHGVTSIKKKNQFAFITSDKDNCYLSVRGTDDIKDVIDDASALVMVHRHEFGKVHNGFADGFDLLNETIRDYLDEMDDISKPIIITGHSLGAAVCCLLALSLKKHGHKVKKIYTFGQPRVGGREWKSKFNHKYYKLELYRFVNGQDIVTKVPVTSRYCHVGNSIYFGKKGKVINNRSKDFFNTGFGDHKMDGYIQNVNNIPENFKPA